MELIQTAWKLLLFFSVFALPQLLGVLAYFRLRRFHNLLAHLVGFLIPPALYLCFSLLLSDYLRQTGPTQKGCGMAAVAAGFIILIGGTGAQIIFSLTAQLTLRGRHRAD